MSLNMRLSLILLAFLTIKLTGIMASEPLSPERLWDLRRIGDVTVSPDGTHVAYLVSDYDLNENGSKATLYVQKISTTVQDSDKSLAFGTPLAKSDALAILEGVKGLNSLSWLNHTTGPQLIYIAPGPEGAQVTDESQTEHAKAPEGAPEGASSDAETSADKAPAESPQAWRLPFDTITATAGTPVQLTQVAGGIGNLKASPSGDAVAFTVDVALDPKVTETDFAKDLPLADARIIDSLMYRHWDAWHDYAYSHVHVARINEAGQAEDVTDLMKSMKADCPVPPFGGSEQFAFAPDGKEIAITLKLVDDWAQSTDTDVYLIDLASDDWSKLDGGRKNISEGMPGYDMEPRYSPDGQTIAFHSMERASFEADRNRIMLYNRKTAALHELTSGLDQTAHNATWSSDSKFVYFYSETRGTSQVFRLRVADSQLERVSTGRFDFAVVDTIPGTSQVLLRQQSMLRPTELAVADASGGSVVTITDVNHHVMQDLSLPTIEERFFAATDGKSIHSWVILPPGYGDDPNKKWPMLTYCQGGPQGQIGQWFSYRWNFHMMAAKGYVVLAVNRRGLPGFGRAWNDQISGDWGGQAMQDILSATDGMLADPKIDAKRVAAIGASFGGYTVYWLMGNAGDRFCSMIAHCGVYNLESMYGATEELFFVNWDLGGPYWSSQEVAAKYEKFSPHKFAANWKTPLLVIHGQKDYRVPVTQGMEAFTAAQVQGVPSRFLYFPEEGHWVMKPQNGVLWGRVFFDWLGRYCPTNP